MIPDMTLKSYIDNRQPSTRSTTWVSAPGHSYVLEPHSTSTTSARQTIKDRRNEIEYPPDNTLQAPSDTRHDAHDGVSDTLKYPLDT